MLVITGWNSKIAEELRGLLWDDEVISFDRLENIVRATYDDMPLDADRYFFCSGYLAGKKLQDMTPGEIETTVAVNFTKVVGACESIFAVNTRARVCLMGSESAYAGSYDDLYAMSKRSLHNYVETKKLDPMQQLVAVSPGIIGDAGMTTRRTDRPALVVRAAKNPKKRFVNSIEAAKLVHFLLYEDEGYITNTVIRMHGGEHIR